MSKINYIKICEDAGREYALTYKDCFAKYSTKSYIVRFAQSRWSNLLNDFENKEIEIPKEKMEKCQKTFIKTFTNVMLDIIDKMPKTDNPYVLKAINESKKNK